MDLLHLNLFAQANPPNSFLYSFEQIGLAGRIIIAVLLVLNLFSFTVLFSKIWTLMDARKRNEDFLRNYRKGESPLDLFLRDKRFLGSPLWSLYRSACFELNQTLQLSKQEQNLLRSKLVPSQMEGVRAALERSLGERILQFEGRMSILASAVSGAPFLGLLGTVWGVMNTFSAVAASQGNPNLSEMAPGISAALLTTVFALLVAIPAMFGYNFLVNQIRSMSATLENFRAEFLAIIERLYVEHQLPVAFSSTSTHDGIAGEEVKEAASKQSFASQAAISQDELPSNVTKKVSTFGLSKATKEELASKQAKRESPILASEGNTAEVVSGQKASQETYQSASELGRHSPLRDEEDVLEDIQKLLAAERARQQHSLDGGKGQLAKPPIKLPNPGV